MPRLNSLLARLLIGSGVPLALFLAVAVVSGIVMYRLLEAEGWEQHSLEVLIKALRQQERLDEMYRAIREELLPDAGDLRTIYERARRQFLQGADQLEKLVPDNPRQLQRIQENRDREAELNRLVEAALQERGPDPSRQMLEDSTRRLDEAARPLVVRMRQEHDDFIASEQQLLVQRRDKVQAETWQSLWWICSASVLATVVGIGVLYRSARSVTGPIQRLREAAGKLLAGTFRVVSPEGPLEIAALTVQFNHMGLSLTERTTLLQKQEERYRTYIGASTHILWTANAQGEVVADIPAWRAFTGQSEEAVRGNGWLDAVHPDDQPAARSAWARAHREGSIFELEYRLRNKCGEYRDVACRAVPIRNADDTIREWIGTCTDVTERKREAGLRRDKEAAEEANRAKTKFLAKMSHELRTPLNAVIGMSKMLSTQRFGELNAKQADYLADITRSGEHLLALINDILDLAKVEAGRMELHPEPFSLHAVVAEAVTSLRPLAEGKRLALALQTPPNDGELATDPARLKQILYNLLSNAIKFTPEGGAVTVTCQWLAGTQPGAAAADSAGAAAVRLEVRDTGIGIAPQDQAVIWQEFRQLKGGLAANTEGTGLGLALTRRLAHLLGGRVGLESQVGAGSTFWVVLPRKLLTGEPRPAPPPDRPVALVVEDYGPTNKLLCDWLTEAGLAAVAAYDGPSGLEQARRLRPRLIVLDIQLPGLDGWQVLTELKGQPETAAIPVVIVTMTEDKQPAAGLEVQGFFVKPVDREFFLQRLRSRWPDLFVRPQPIRILVVDADAEARARLHEHLSTDRTTVVEVGSAEAALEVLHRDPPALLVLDPLAEGGDGFALVETIRQRPEWHHLPILIVTAKVLHEDQRRRLNGHIQALLSKQRLTGEQLRQLLTELGLLRE
jgi:PAS domain S-box-containing protein